MLCRSYEPAEQSLGLYLVRRYLPPIRGFRRHFSCSCGHSADTPTRVSRHWRTASSTS